MNALMMVLPFGFYYAFTTNEISIDGLHPNTMLYTGIAYIASFIALVFSILKRNLALFRLLLIINFLIALPAKAYIGMVIEVISILLSFHKKVKKFFASTGKIGI
tara:strand:- start:499 stop:813 length:315 start_codon:yes stop_codon:yes gene_type:complete